MMFGKPPDVLPEFIAERRFNARMSGFVTFIAVTASISAIVYAIKSKNLSLLSSQASF